MSTPEIILNDETGKIELYRDWIEDAEILFKQLRDSIKWNSRSIQLFGKTHQIPRLESWQSKSGISYGYSGQEYVGSGWSINLINIVDHITEQLGWQPNGALLNFYRSGSDGMGWHSDNERELGMNPTVAILSLGVDREIQFRLNANHKKKLKIGLKTGSLLLVSGEAQHHWQHAVPKKKLQTDGERISCTFRKVIID